jgi:hypothetical protein
MVRRADGADAGYDLRYVLDGPAADKAFEQPNTFKNVEIDLGDIIPVNNHGDAAVTFHSCKMFY